MQNEADGSLSEWGYSSIDELIELGFEMDLYFENRVLILREMFLKRRL